MLLFSTRNSGPPTALFRRIIFISIPNAIRKAILCVPQTLSSPATQFNSTSSSSSSSSVVLGGELTGNGTDATTESRISSLFTHLPTLKNIVIVVCVVTVALITLLVIKIFRSGRRIRKTRKYDIITTPTERVEMAPLNEENDDEDDSTLFDVKYR
ncbi:membrane protein FAM174B-like [Diretmus argenteus]